jgi:hypothetical protein
MATPHASGIHHARNLCTAKPEWADRPDQNAQWFLNRDDVPVETIGQKTWRLVVRLRKPYS